METEIQQNILFCIHTELGSFLQKFRIRVCKECNWSEATYYRKMRSPGFAGYRRRNSLLSNAEKEKIISIRKEIVKEIIEELDNEPISCHRISF